MRSTMDDEADRASRAGVELIEHMVEEGGVGEIPAAGDEDACIHG